MFSTRLNLDPDTDKAKYLDPDSANNGSETLLTRTDCLLLGLSLYCFDFLLRITRKELFAITINESDVFVCPESLKCLKRG